MKFKRIITILLSIIVLILSFSCKQRTKISGHIANYNKQYAVLYKLTPSSIEAEDTVLLTNGHFVHYPKVENISVYLLRFNDTCFASFILQALDTLYIKATAPNINRSMEIKGNIETELLQQTRQQLFLLEDSVKKLSDYFIAHQYDTQLDSLHRILEHQFNIYYDNHRAYLQNFIEKNPNKLASLLAFYQTLGRNSFFSPSEDKAILQNIYQTLSQTYPNSEYILDLGEKLSIND